MPAIKYAPLGLPAPGITVQGVLDVGTPSPFPLAAFGAKVTSNVIGDKIGNTIMKPRKVRL
jgi:hypothetical protein